MSRLNKICQFLCTELLTSYLRLTLLLKFYIVITYVFQAGIHGVDIPGIDVVEVLV